MRKQIFMSVSFAAAILDIVTGESQGYRVQKFIYKGLSTTAR